MQEIERKFLVKNNHYKKDISRSYKIAQGYLCLDPKRTVRIRLKDQQGYITIKGESNVAAITRFEWEKEISIQEAMGLFALCLPGKIEKIRHEIIHGNHCFEVDEFSGHNNGLIIAEVELKDENEAFEKPEWLGQEVTEDFRYYNAYLSEHPFEKWKNTSIKE
jgi:adenylate cyclase